MNKFGIVLGVTAVVTLAGCVDPNHKGHQRSRNEPKMAAPVVVEPAVPVPEAKPVAPVQDVEIVEVVKVCTCPPGTKHAVPCGCGAAGCACEVVKPEPKPVAPVEETTDYIVQRGDYLAKISKKFNVTISSLRRVNPQLKGDTIRIGQKIKIPGKVDVGVQKVPAGAFAETPKAAPKAYKPYVGATKDYTVKAGDTLGAIAYSNGVNIRQLKELNALSSNTIRVGQKLKVPAGKAKAPAVEKKIEPKPVEAKKPVEEPKPVVEPKPVEEPKVEPPAVAGDDRPTVATNTPPAEAKSAAPAAEDFVSYVVQEGEDILNLSIRFGLSPTEIRELNNLSPDDSLKPGQVLKLPPDTQL